jgi:hypothetical protein
MFVDLPAGMESMARSGANPFRPSEILTRFHELTRALQRRPGDALQTSE